MVFFCGYFSVLDKFVIKMVLQRFYGNVKEKNCFKVKIWEIGIILWLLYFVLFCVIDVGEGIYMQIGWKEKERLMNNKCM